MVVVNSSAVVLSWFGGEVLIVCFDSDSDGLVS